MSIRVFVVDDHALFREGLIALLNEQEDLSCVGSAEDGDCVDALRAAAADVVLLDVNMPRVHGIEAARVFREACPQTKIVMVTMVEDDTAMFAAMEAGARGYVLKGSDVSEMLGVIRAVAAGQLMFGGLVADRMLARLSAPRAQRQPSTDGAFATLTAREREVLDLLARGLKNAEIGEHLFISPTTVRNHITNLFSKLDVTDRAAAIVLARKGGYGD